MMVWSITTTTSCTSSRSSPSPSTSSSPCSSFAGGGGARAGLWFTNWISPLSGLLLLLLALTTSPTFCTSALVVPTTTTTTTTTTWLIDGNNLKCSRGVPDNRWSIMKELYKIASPRQHLVVSSSSHGGDLHLPKTTEEKKQQDKEMDDTSSQMSSSSCSISNVLLVFDGNHNESFSYTSFRKRWFQIIITDGYNREKDRADNYIVDIALPELSKNAINDTIHQQQHSTTTTTILTNYRNTSCVHLVTADKELGKRASRSGYMGRRGSIVYPPKFWKQYLPNLKLQTNNNNNNKKKKSANKIRVKNKNQHN